MMCHHSGTLEFWHSTVTTPGALHSLGLQFTQFDLAFMKILGLPTGSCWATVQTPRIKPPCALYKPLNSGPSHTTLEFTGLTVCDCVFDKNIF